MLTRGLPLEFLKTMNDDIDKTLRPEGSSLDISRAELDELSAQVSQLVSDYYSEIRSLPVFPETHAGKTSEQIGTLLPTAGEAIGDLLDDCRSILSGSRHNGHPRFFGYVASPSTAPGVFADLIASAVNVNVTSWRSGPAATEIERTVIGWLAEMIGYASDSQKSFGLLTSGGSMANFTALLIAHRAKAGSHVARHGLWNSRPMTIYASSEIHMSIPKAADMLGLGRQNVRLVECDERFRINVSKLRERIVADLENGLQPFCVVASAGTVNTGAVDQLADIADVANEFDLWFHVDGAYGALAALDQSKRQMFAGLDRADSISLDPHKWLYVPLDSGCLLFRDEARARAAFSFDEADYIKVHEQDEDEAFAFWNYGPELSRRFRALKIWLTLRYYGTQRIAAAIREDNALASYMGECIDRANDFELLATPELSICCFRYVPPSFLSRVKARSLSEADNEALDRLNNEIMLAVQRGGGAYVSNATVGGRFALRACITNFRTTRADIEQTLDIIRDAGRAQAKKDNEPAEQAEA